MIRAIILILIFIVLMISNLFAQSETEINPVIVTATRIEESQLDVPQNVTVITKNEIEKSGAKNIAEVLDKQAGIQIIDYGPEGAQKTVTLRGSTSAQVLVLIDGVRLNNSQSGGVDLSLIPLDNIERIEIVRGGNSSLYGADAVGGVINIITKKKNNDKVSIKIENSGFIPQKYVIGYGTAKKYCDPNLLSLVDGQKITFGYFPKIKSILLSNILTLKRAENGYFATDNSYENRKIENASLMSGNINSSVLIPLKNSSININGTVLINKKGVPGSLKSPSPKAEQEDRSIFTFLKYNTEKFIFDFANLKLTAYYQYKYLHYYNPDPSYSNTPENSTHRINRYGIDIMQNLFLFDSLLPVYGININYDTLNSTDIGLKNRLHIGGFIENNIYIKDFNTLIPAIRYDYYSDFSGNLNFSIGFIHKINTTSSIKSYISKSYRVPTFNDMYWPETNFVSGNPALKPETGYSIEVGYAKEDKRNYISATAFLRYIKDVILWLEGDDSKWRPSNYGEAIYPGIELQIQKSLSNNLIFHLNYTYIYSFTLSGDYRISDNKRVPYIPVHKFSANIEYDTKKYNIIIEEQYTGKRFTGTTNEDYLHSYFITNLNFIYKLSKKSELNINIDNLFNESYQIQPSYPMPGLSINLGYKIKF